MFRRLGLLAARYPLQIVAAWIVILVGVLATTPKLSDIVSSSQSSYLPSSANSQRAQAILQQAFPASYARSSAIVILTGHANARVVAEADYSGFAARRLRPAPFAVASDSLTPQLRGALDSRDGQATLISLGWRQQDSSTLPADSVTALRAYIAAHPHAGVVAQVTGGVAINADYQDQVNKSTNITTIATVALVVIILLVVFRSLALLIVPLATIGIGVAVSMGVVAELGTHGLTISSNTPIFMIVLLAGAGTDYCLFLASRFREELRSGLSPAGAIVATMTHVGEAIASSAAAVIVGLGGMAFAQFGLFNTTGPAVAISVAVTLLAALTLTPAILRLLGTRAFWPARAEAAAPSRFWVGIGQLVTRRPMGVIAAILLLVIPLNLAVLRVGQNFNFLGDLNATVEARAGFSSVEAHFGAGNALPGTLVIQSPSTLRTAGSLQSLDRLNVELAALPGVRAVQGPTRPAGQPIAYQAYARSPQIQAAIARNLSPDGRVAQYTVTGGADPYSAAAQELMRTARSRAEASFSGSAVYTNGASVQTVDIHDVIGGDLARIALFVLGGILLVLIVLVRALVAPLYLLLSVVLSLGATIGATSIVFQGFGGQSGLVFWVPFIILTMLIGLATDYNILIVSRVREELRGNPDTRAAVAHAVSQTGGIIVTCGLVLAGSFGTLMLASVTGLRELGFAVAFGVIFDTVLLRTMLIPALIVVVGDWSWFPGRLASAARPAPAALPGNAGIRAPFGQSATRSEPGR